MHKKVTAISIIVVIAGILVVAGYWIASRSNDVSPTIDQQQPESTAGSNQEPPAPGATDPQTNTQGQPSPRSSVRVHDLRESTDLVQRLNQASGSDADRLREVFQLGSATVFMPVKENTDPNNNRHIRYRQSYREIPLWGEQVVIHKNAGGDIYRVTGNVIQLSDTQALDEKLQAIDVANPPADLLDTLKGLNGHAQDVWQTNNDQLELTLYLNDNGEAIPVYAASYFASPRYAADADYSKPNALEPTRPHFLVDANSREILQQWDGLTHADASGAGGNEKTGRYVYGTDYPPLEITDTNGTCTLENANVKTVNLNHSEDLALDQAFELPCYNNDHKAINGAYAPLNDAHFFGGVTFDMYQDWFDSAPLNFQLKMNVHFGHYFQNAFWNGFEMTFGDGAGALYPLVDINIVSHEISHGVTTQNSSLIYQNQSGGINEAFSDIAGEAAEYYMRGTVDWFIGGEATKANRGGGLRYFIDPRLDGLSIIHASAYYDGLDVHYSSGVYNHAYYQLATTPGWNPQTAFYPFYYANTNYWVPDETFDNGACGVMDAAHDLGYDPRDIDDAFQAVGVNCGSVPFIDDDGDQMDDRWETANALDPTNGSDGVLDSDGDGLDNLTEYQLRSDPHNADTDSDGIDDYEERFSYNTDLRRADSDNDGLSDSQEISVGTDPNNADTDNDGIDDGWEVANGLDANDPADASADNDQDGLSNADEFLLGSNPNSSDTDGDGLSDGEEVSLGTDIARVDTDYDGVSDSEEVNLGTDPTNPDSDGDFLSDGEELALGSNPLATDTDGDDLLDGAEASIHFTDPTLADTDADLMPDGWEVSMALNPLLDDSAEDPDADTLVNLDEYLAETDAQNPDTDGDTLPDGVEVHVHNTNPTTIDTDADTLFDNWEINFGLDPLIADDQWQDSDGDGWAHTQENLAFTDPFDNTDKPSVPTQPLNVLVESIGDCYANGCREALSAWVGNVYQREYRGYIRAQLPYIPWTLSSANLELRIASVTSTNASETLNLYDLDVQRLGSEQQSSLLWEDLGSGELYAQAEVSQSNQVSVFSLSLAAVNEINQSQTIAMALTLANISFTEDFRYVNVSSANPESQFVFDFFPDTDNDGMTDEWETQHGLNINLAGDALIDSDADGLINLQEYIYRSDPFVVDTDGDSLSDADEVRIYGTSPVLTDSDGDGLDDAEEVANNTDPANADSDGDGLSDAEEINIHGSDPNNVDTDGDGIEDGVEVTVHNTDPTSADTDGDGLNDYDEINVHNTPPTNPDADGDGINDGDEIAIGLNPLDASDSRRDSDSDGWTDHQEYRWQSDFNDPDSIPVIPTTPVSSAVAVTNSCTPNIGCWPQGSNFDVTSGYLSFFNLPASEGFRTGFTFELPDYPWDADAVAFQSSVLDVVSDAGSENFRLYAVAGIWPDAIPPADVASAWQDFGDGSVLGETSVSAPGLLNIPLNAAGVNAVNQPGGTRVQIGAVLSHVSDSINEYVLTERGTTTLSLTYPEDADGDGLPDAWESANGLSPADAGDGLLDFDGDGLINIQEFIAGADPNDNDTDNDGLNDREEVEDFGSSPTDYDSDNDGLNDFDEIYTYSTNVNVADTDGDGLSDYDEIHVYGTSPLSADSDRDGLTDYDEINVHLTDPGVADSDGDGIDDGAEIGESLDPLQISDGFVDSDGDGWTDAQEINLGSDRFDNNQRPTVPTIPASQNLRHWGDCVEALDRCRFRENLTLAGWIPTQGEFRNFWQFDVPQPWTVEAIDLQNYYFFNLTAPNTLILSDVTTPLVGVSDHVATAFQDFGGGQEYGQIAFDPATQSEGPMFTALNQTVVSDFNQRRGNTFAIGGRLQSGMDASERQIVYDYAPFTALVLSFTADNDNDGISDDWETANGLNPQDATDSHLDNDGDGLINLQEFINRTDPFNADTDGDGASDGDEFFVYYIDPLNPDIDGDGLPDGWEIQYGLDPHTDDANLDGDADTLTNTEEYVAGTSPTNDDTDGDGLLDGSEIDDHNTDPTNSDTDGDGISDFDEVSLWYSNPLAVNTVPMLVLQTPSLTGITLSDVVTMQGVAWSPNPIDRIEVWIDDVLVGNAIGTDSWQYDWDTTRLDNNAHEIMFVVRDTNGQGFGARFNYLIDNTGAAQFNAILGTPFCDGISYYCDSHDLVLGRGTIANGIEANQPNTLLTSQCQDGTAGTYGFDESLDRIRIASVNGDDLASGVEANIEITMHAWSSYTADHVDVYYSANADDINPQWDLVASLQPTEAGFNSLSTTVTIPGSAGDVHAVRGVVRYGGSPTSCGSGGYNDYDDLVFVVDNIVPTPSITLSVASPTEGETVNSTVQVRGSVQTQEVMTGVEIWVNNTFVSNAVTWVDNENWTFDWDTTVHPSGLTTLMVRALINGGFSQEVAMMVDVDNPTATFNSVVGVPECTDSGLACDTGTLIDGRDTISGGPELNAPNTLFGSCDDGASGQYHIDESLDRLRIHGWDGFNLQQNRVAVIDAWVWPWQGFANDYLDIYIKPEITNSNSDWNHVATLNPYAANQLNKLSYPLVLPASVSGRLAIRGVFRYGSLQTPCDLGAYSDHDDLIITLTPEDSTQNQAPSLVWAVPQPEATTPLSGNYQFVVNTADDNAVSHVQYQVLDSNQTVVLDVISTLAPQFIINWDTQTVANGTYQLRATVVDNQGKQYTSVLTRTVSN